jgi:hypothetical protein
VNEEAVSEGRAIATGMAEFRKTIRPRLRVHALVLVSFAALVAYLAELPVRKIIGVAGLTAVALWVVLAWVERTWLPANLRDRYRRSRTAQP